MSHAPRPLGGKLITPVTVLCALLLGICGYFLVMRFVYGYNAAAAFNDGYSWGIWLAYDVIIGTAFACGGYAMAIMVYVFNKGEYHPLVRPALLASLFGYCLGGFSVAVDLGRYWNMWHMFWPAYAQPNSVMFEVGCCIGTYCLVLTIEFSPAVLERLGLTKIKALVERVMFFFIALGILLPTMHQSSLGSMTIIFGNQLHPLWHTLLLPLLFIISAVTMGFCIVVFEATLVSVGFRRPGEAHLLGKMAGVVMTLLVVWLVIRLSNLAYEGKLALALTHDWINLMFWAEIALFALPVLILLPRRNRYHPQKLFIAAVLMLLGGSLYRLDAYLVAYYPATPGFHYFPSAPELLISIGFIALEVLGYIVLARLLPVLPGLGGHKPAQVAAE